jgi:hypothetical protein
MSSRSGDMSVFLDFHAFDRATIAVEVFLNDVRATDRLPT